MKINITHAAISHLQKMITQRGAKAFRLSVRAAGCNGYRYHPEIVTTIENHDIKIQIAPDLLVMIDPNCRDMIDGITIDYVTTGLGQSQLKFINPNVSGECGCGESFNIKSESAHE